MTKEKIEEKNWSMVIAKPTRNIKRALCYWYPKRLTLKDNPRIHAWLWWNF